MKEPHHFGVICSKVVIGWCSIFDSFHSSTFTLNKCKPCHNTFSYYQVVQPHIVLYTLTSNTLPFLINILLLRSPSVCQLSEMSPVYVGKMTEMYLCMNALSWVLYRAPCFGPLCTKVLMYLQGRSFLFNFLTGIPLVIFSCVTRPALCVRAS